MRSTGYESAEDVEGEDWWTNYALNVGYNVDALAGIGVLLTVW